ncbi:MAG TPA: DUF1587 domain-containing protein, partial [Terriglobia bacterium]|nr:DUF1587 domain-containing protein [Terriglobia bacterium]
MKTSAVRLVLTAFGLLLIPAVVSFSQGPSSQSASNPQDAVHYKTVITQYCVGCHNDRLKTADLSLEHMDLANVAQSPDIWEKAVRKVRVGMMPPQVAAKPDEATRRGLVSWLTDQLDRAAADHPNPGRPLLHRLNRVEYGNAIRDLLALDVDPSALLPPDDAAYG